MTAAPVFFLLVDAIPCDLAHDIWADGGMAGFMEPRPMVSVFPSLTNVAVPSLLQQIFEKRPPGYEARYYDASSGEVRGGFRDAESEAAMEPFRTRPRGLLAHVAVYFLRGALAYGQIRWITHRFRQEGGPWLGYLSATDGVAHFGGRSGLERAFRDICVALGRARQEYLRQHGILPGVVLCSDHGMGFGRLDHLSEADLAALLEEAGFGSGKAGPDGVTLVPYGDVGGGVVYADPARAAEVAEIVAEAPGVDVAFGRIEGGCEVFALREEMSRARILWRDEFYRYEPQHGDPLEYVPVWRALAEAGKLRDGWAGDQDLFARSWRHRYPDALARVRHGLLDLVRNPAPVLFSMKESYSYGPALTHLGAQLMGGQMGTHGALAASESIGFATRTHNGDDPWSGAPALRPEDVFRPWRELVRAGGASESPRENTS